MKTLTVLGALVMTALFVLGAIKVGKILAKGITKEDPQQQKEKAE